MSRLNGGSAGNGQADAARARIAAAMVQLVGHSGYEAISVEMVCERAGVEPGLFELCFADKERCFLSLYDQIAAELCRDLRAAWDPSASWHDRVWAAGWAAMRFLEEDAARTRFLLVEVNGIGRAAQAHRDEILRRLAELIDEGRHNRGQGVGQDGVGFRGGGASSRRATLCSAEIVAGAIYRMTLERIEAGAIDRGEDFLPELIYMAVVPYLGASVAERELQVEPLL
jgi:AcrR family transcriptional regulator